MKCTGKILLFFCLLSSSLYARGKGVTAQMLEEPQEFPWYTGPLLAASGHNVPKGWGDVNVYNFVIDTFGTFNDHGHGSTIPTFIDEVPVVIIQFGATDWLDISYTGGVNFQFSQGQQSVHYGDTFFTLGFQLMEQEKNSLKPDARLTVTQEIPTGKYKNLNPRKKETDLNGDGSYRTTIGLNFQKTFYGMEHHPCRMRWNLAYTYSAPTHVSGFNAYGGGFGASGKVIFDPIFQTIYAIEIALTKNWVYAMDITYSIAGEAKFKGTPGTSSAVAAPAIGDLPTPFSQGSKKSSYISFAPAVEYNFSAALGVIGGIWYSPWGVNSTQFVAYILAVNYIFPVGKMNK